MKKLYLIRHAQAVVNENRNDFDRALTEQGEKEALHMAMLLKQRNVLPSRLVSSSALRALTTCKIFANTLDIDKLKIETTKKLYHASAKNWLEVLKELKENPNDNEVVLVFGHNPGITAFANALLNIYISHIPTCGVVSATLNIKTWSEIDFGCGTLDSFDYPEEL